MSRLRRGTSIFKHLGMGQLAVCGSMRMRDSGRSQGHSLTFEDAWIAAACMPFWTWIEPLGRMSPPPPVKTFCLPLEFRRQVARCSTSMIAGWSARALLMGPSFPRWDNTSKGKPVVGQGSMSKSNYLSPAVKGLLDLLLGHHRW